MTKLDDLFRVVKASPAEVFRSADESIEFWCSAVHAELLTCFRDGSTDCPAAQKKQSTSALIMLSPTCVEIRKAEWRLVVAGGGW